MARKIEQEEPEVVVEESQIDRLENRIAVLEAIIEKHIKYHFGGVN